MGVTDAVPSLDEPLLDVEQAAELLNVRESWIREASRKGFLPCLKVGKHLRYTRTMLENWLAENRVRPGRRFTRKTSSRSQT